MRRPSPSAPPGGATAPARTPWAPATTPTPGIAPGIAPGRPSWRQVMWRRQVITVDGYEVTFQQNGTWTCECQDYRTSQFAKERLDGNKMARNNKHAVYCKHIIDLHVRAQDELAVPLLNSVLEIFDDDGVYWANHEWRFEVREERDMLDFQVFMFKAKPRMRVLTWTCGLTPCPETNGMLWNVYYEPVSAWESDTGLLAVHPDLHNAGDTDGFYHIGFYNAGEPLLDIAKLVAAQFVDIALAAQCVKCRTLMDPAHLSDPARGRWDAINRGHFMETHNGSCQSCDDTDLVPLL